MIEIFVEIFRRQTSTALFCSE